MPLASPLSNAPIATNEGVSGPNPVLTVREVATELRCSKAHVYKIIRGSVSGLSPLPALGLGRRRLVRRSTLEQWVAANERAPGDAILIASQKNHAVDA